MSFSRMDALGFLPTPGAMSSPPQASSQEKRGIAETFAQAGWGKRDVEECESILDKLRCCRRTEMLTIELVNR